MNIYNLGPIALLILIFEIFLSANLASAEKPKGDYPLDWKNHSGLRLPVVGDPKLSQVLYSKHTVFYKLPSIYQQNIPASEVIHYNPTLGTTTTTQEPERWGIYYSSYLPDFNGNLAFPWEGTLGYNGVAKEGLIEKRYGAVNFIYLPGKETDPPIPVMVLNEVPIKWIFPVGAILGEILWVKDDKGTKWVFEVRCREKLPGSLAWEPIIFRPMRNRQELLRYLGYSPKWQPPRTYMFFRNVHEDEVFKMEGMVERIPKMTPDQVRAILSKPFVDVTYESWSELPGAPAADEEISIFPKNYNLGLITPEEVSCSGCHRQTSISVRNLIPKEPLIFNNPFSVGNIRGSDGIFSWHPMSDESISDGTDNGQLKIRLRPYDVTNKRVIFFDPNKSLDTKRYKLTKYVQEALKPYELPKNPVLLH